MFWIRIGFNADPDVDPNPVFFISMRIRIRIWIQVAKQVQIRIRILVRLWRTTVEFLLENILIGQKTYLRRYKSFFESQKLRFICKFWSIFMVLDPDPDPHCQYRSGSKHQSICIPRFFSQKVSLL